MSVHATYCLWLHADPSTLLLEQVIDEADWWEGERPKKGKRGGDTFYFWSAVCGPYFRIKTDDGKIVSPPVEVLINEVKDQYPDLQANYALFVSVEGNYRRTDGGYAYDLHEKQIIWICDPGDEYKAWEVEDFFDTMTGGPGRPHRRSA